MSALEIAKNVYSVGVLNPHMRVFDIVMETEYGTSYNAYLVKGKEKTALIDTVQADFFSDYWENILKICDPASIDYLIMNHNEPDHSGSVPMLLEKCPNLTVYTTQAGALYLKNIANRDDLPICVAKDGETLDLGNETLQFISAPFLHWPDSMFTYLPEEKTLFTCDFLGAHYCEPRMIDQKMRPCDQNTYFEEVADYYQAIFSPFKPYVLKGLEKMKDCSVAVAAPSHGPILTKDGFLAEVVKRYQEWSTPISRENKRIPIFYCSAYHNTERLAQAIADGVKEALPDAEVRLCNMLTVDIAKQSEWINTCSGCLIGSPTINRDALPPVWNLLSHVDAINFSKRPVGIFGSYGWSGEAASNIRGRLQGLRAKVYDTDFRVVFVPSKDDLKKAKEYGRAFAESL